MRLFITTLMQIIPHCIGIQIIIFFGYEIMKEMNIHSIFLSILLIFFSGLFGTLLLFRHVEKKGRHFLLSVGNNCIGVIWILLAAIVYYKMEYFSTSSASSSSSAVSAAAVSSSSYFSPSFRHTVLSYLIKSAVICLFCLFYCVYYLSWGSISWIYSAEIFPYRARGKAVSITSSIHYVAALTASQLLQMVLQSKFDDDDAGFPIPPAPPSTPPVSQHVNDDLVSILFPTNTSSWNVSSKSIVNDTISYLSAVAPPFTYDYSFSPYLNLHNTAYCFLVLGIVCFSVNIVIYLLIPETSGMFMLFPFSLLSYSLHSFLFFVSRSNVRRNGRSFQS
jgi:hypothetical protein